MNLSVNYKYIHVIYMPVETREVSCWYELPPCLACECDGRSFTVQPDCIKGRIVCRTVYGDMLLGFNCKSKVSCPCPGFLSSAT